MCNDESRVRPYESATSIDDRRLGKVIPIMWIVIENIFHLSAKKTQSPHGSSDHTWGSWSMLLSGSGIETTLIESDGLQNEKDKSKNIEKMTEIFCKRWCRNDIYIYIYTYIYIYFNRNEKDSRSKKYQTHIICERNTPFDVSMINSIELQIESEYLTWHRWIWIW